MTLRFGRRSRASGADRRRSGPEDEERWWDPTDQAFAERGVLDRRILGPRWIDAPMVNNTERRQPYGSDEASVALERQRLARGTTALDEGRAWRHRDTRALVVARIEVFADADDSAHRAAWERRGAAILEATWRERWQERDLSPGWIEARAVGTGERPDPLHAFAEARPSGAASAVDWFQVEDHTDPTGGGEVTMYQHLTVWAGRGQVVLVARHDLGQVVDKAVAAAADAVHQRLLTLEAPR